MGREESTESCIIHSLLKKPFSQRSPQEKTDIITNGKPCPILSNLKSHHKEKNRDYVRSFNVSQYNNNHWLTGSKKLNKLFCWPCLLFCDDKGVWSKSGFDNLNTLTLATLRHEKSANHIKSFLQLNSFRRTSLDHQLSEHKRINDLLHNEKVRKNRELLKRQIDAVCCLAKQNIPFNTQDESLTSLNGDNYAELLELISRYDPLLEANLKESTVFCGDFRMDLITAISSVITNRLKTEIEQTAFVALVINEASDTINKSQLATVLRYIDENCEVQERFLGIFDSGTDHTDVTLLEHVTAILNEYDCGEKIVAHSYDGAVVTPDEIDGLNKQVQELFPRATFVHCHSHRLNLTLQQCASKIKECRTFFQSMSSLTVFFSKPKRIAILEDFIKKQWPAVAPRWNFSQTIHTVKEHYCIFMGFFKYMLDAPEEWQNDEILKARGFLVFLKMFSTRFLTTVFSNIFVFSKSIMSILETKSLETDFCSFGIEELCLNIQKMRDTEFSNIYDFAECKFLAEEHVHNGFLAQDESEKIDYEQLFTEILNNILALIRGRFISIGHLRFFALMNDNLFQNYNENFPESEMKCLEETYGSLFDIVRLKTELSVMYSSDEFQNKNVSEILKFMHFNKMYLGMPEVFKLVKLIVTIPAATSFTESSFSALERINAYCTSMQDRERLSQLAVISIEKALLAKMKLETEFYHKVTEKFLEKESREEFVFK